MSNKKCSFEQLQGFVKMVTKFWADILFVNNRETWFFGHNILHRHRSAICNQFLYNFACWSIKKEPELYPIYVYQLGYSILHDSRNNNVGQSQKWAWLEESCRLVSKSSAKLPVGYTQHGKLMMDAMLLVICLGSSAGVGQITKPFITKILLLSLVTVGGCLPLQ